MVYVYHCANVMDFFSLPWKFVFTSEIYQLCDAAKWLESHWICILHLQCRKQYTWAFWIDEKIVEMVIFLRWIWQCILESFQSHLSLQLFISFLQHKTKQFPKDCYYSLSSIWMTLDSSQCKHTIIKRWITFWNFAIDTILLNKLTRDLTCNWELKPRLFSLRYTETNFI